MKAATKVAADAWLAALASLDGTDAPDGETAGSMAPVFKCSRVAAARKLKRLADAGKAECVGWRKCGSTRTKVYRLVATAPKVRK